MQLRARSRHVGIALVGAYHDIACGGDAEIAARHTGVCREEFVTQTETGAISEIGGIVIAFLRRDTLLFEQLAYVIVVQMDGGHHDVTRLLTLQLDDALAEVSLYDLDALRFQIGVHLALFCQHRLRLYHLLHVVLLQNAVHNLIEFAGILSPMDDATVLFCIRRELVEIFV